MTIEDKFAQYTGDKMMSNDENPGGPPPPPKCPICNRLLAVCEANGGHEGGGAGEVG